jgi:hypothetical protein
MAHFVTIQEALANDVFELAGQFIDDRMPGHVCIPECHEIGGEPEIVEFEAFHVSHKCGHSVWFSFPDDMPITTDPNRAMLIRVMISGIRKFDCIWCGGESHAKRAKQGHIASGNINGLAMRMRQDIKTGGPDEIDMRVNGYHSFCTCDD